MSILHPIAANLQPDGLCRFSVWAPNASSVDLLVLEPDQQNFPLKKLDYGYWEIIIPGVTRGTRYVFQLNGQLKRPDPASRFQPDGVHGASAVVDHAAFTWTDQNWQGIPVEKYIIYELHPGTFTAAHTFEGIISKLDYLLDLGITAIELMPVAQFPGSRNWGYDGVYPFAVQESYDGPEGLKKLVNACHEKGLTVILDVVYNHLGPEGNYLQDFGPYFTDKYQTPWGKALNFDDAGCDGVRNFFIQNALMWFRDYHVDALRLDAVHAIIDLSANHFLKELAENVAHLSQEKGRKFYLIAESDLNDVRLINPISKGGYGLDAQWSDDFHHAVHSYITGEKDGYYQDFGQLSDLQKVYEQAFLYNGIYAPHRQKTFGSDTSQNPASQFVVCIQNHDQIGNRLAGDRLSSLVNLRLLKLAAAAYILSPYIPMLFMGEEYGEKNPFLYFISHTDPELVKAVQEGRKKEFQAFNWSGEIPDPQSKKTFEKSCLSWNYESEPDSSELFEFYRRLIALRKSHPVLSNPYKQNLRTTSDAAAGLLIIDRQKAGIQVRLLLNFGPEPATFPVEMPEPWQLILDSSSQLTGLDKSTWVSSNIIIPAESILVLEQPVKAS